MSKDPVHKNAEELMDKLWEVADKYLSDLDLEMKDSAYILTGATMGLLGNFMAENVAAGATTRDFAAGGYELIPSITDPEQFDILVRGCFLRNLCEWYLQTYQMNHKEKPDEG